MSGNGKTERPRAACDDPPACFDSPDQLWGRRFGRPLVDATLPFEERVARALKHIEATRFVPEEHAQLRKVLAAKIEQELKNA